MEDIEEENLRALISKMRQIAGRVGPLHAWWDIIFDVEAFLASDPTRLNKSAKEWVEMCADELEKHGQRK
jgi:hypothetical protein